MDEVRVSGWEELSRELYANSWQPGIERYRSPYAFRGSPDVDFELSSSLSRLGDSYEELEEHLLRDFRKYSRNAFDDTLADSVWSRLSLAQHHGLPTRLLDWTYSPLVALHFVTADLSLYDRDGVVWCIDYRRTSELLPPKLKRLQEDEASHIFTTEMLDRAAESLDELESLAEEPCVVFFEPPSLDSRIINQFALFSLMTNARSQLGDWIAHRPEMCRRVIVPAPVKWEVRDKLDQANITERVLFPGLDGLSRWLKRYYTPKGAAHESASTEERAYRDTANPTIFTRPG